MTDPNMTMARRAAEAAHSYTIAQATPVAPSVPVPAPEVYITRAEVARRLHRCLRTVDNWMQRGLIPYYKIGKTVSFKWSEVEAHLRDTFRVDRAGGA